MWYWRRSVKLVNIIICRLRADVLLMTDTAYPLGPSRNDPIPGRYQYLDLHPLSTSSSSSTYSCDTVATSVCDCPPTHRKVYRPPKRARKEVRFVQTPSECRQACCSEGPAANHSLCHCLKRGQFKRKFQCCELHDHHERMRCGGLHFLLPIDECRPYRLEDYISEHITKMKRRKAEEIHDKEEGIGAAFKRKLGYDERERETGTEDEGSGLITFPTARETHLTCYINRYIDQHLATRHIATKTMDKLSSDEYNDGFESKEMRLKMKNRSRMLEPIARYGHHANPVDVCYMAFDIETSKSIDATSRHVKEALKQRKGFAESLRARLLRLQDELNRDRKEHFEKGSPRRSYEDLQMLREEANSLCLQARGNKGGR